MGRKVKDLTGQVFGRLTVMSFSHTKHHAFWYCQCECGTMKVVSGQELQKKATRSCGCLNREITDLTGMKFGRLTVTGFHHRDTRTYWNCQCECGSAGKVIVGYTLLNGDTRSCGCLLKEILKTASVTHGLRRHPLYRVWSNMKNRCYNIASSRYPDWGGRGITVCDEWLDFSVFHAWGTATGYKKGLTIERIDNNGNYSPANCRWATLTEQANNKRNTLQILYHGVMQPLGPLASGRWEKVWQRIKKYGWSVDRAVDTP